MIQACLGGINLFVEGCHVRIPNKRLGSLMQLVNPEALADHNLKERGDVKKEKRHGTGNNYTTRRRYELKSNRRLIKQKTSLSVYHAEDLI